VSACRQSAWSTRSVLVRIAAGAIGLAIVAGASSIGRGADSQDDRGMLRFDPISGKMVPVPEGEAKAGCVYSHFSQRLNRRVWAIRQPDGQFSHALGEGTTQSAPSLDMRGTVEERRARLAQVDNDLLQQLARAGGVAYLSLNQAGQWVLDRTATHATVYDIETGYRWECVNQKYIPVSGAYGYRWAVVNGDYVSVGDDRAMGDCPCGWQP
jgi:hypothetical protein